jgi:hypothetical protein
MSTVSIDDDGVATDELDSVLLVDSVLRLDLDAEERMACVSNDSRALGSCSVVIRPMDGRWITCGKNQNLAVHKAESKAELT